MQCLHTMNVKLLIHYLLCFTHKYVFLPNIIKHTSPLAPHATILVHVGIIDISFSEVISRHMFTCIHNHRSRVQTILQRIEMKTLFKQSHGQHLLIRSVDGLSGIFMIHDCLGVTLKYM